MPPVDQCEAVPLQPLEESVKTQPTALQFGKDTSLLESRSAILETTGLAVINAYSVRQCVSEILGGNFDLIILCHTVSPEERDEVASLVHKLHPATPVLLISTFFEKNREIDVIVDCEPEHLVKNVKEILSHQPHKTNIRSISVHKRGA